MSNSPEGWHESDSDPPSPKITSPVMDLDNSESLVNLADNARDPALDIQKESDPRHLATSHSGSDDSSDVPIVEPLRALTSFVPVLEQVQGSLVLEGNEYHLSGYPSESEWVKLQAFASTIEELSISDNGLNAPKVADAVYFLLGQHQGSANPFFPLLSRLCITNTTPTSLPHLSFFFSPSLKKVKLSGLSNNARAALKMFLQRVGKETSLSTLVLDSLKSPLDVLQLTENCHFLETLELCITEEAWNISSLDSIVFLPRLKCLKLDATMVNGSYRTSRATFSSTNKCSSSLEDFYFLGKLSTIANIIYDHVNVSFLRTLHAELLEYDVETTIKVRSNRKIHEGSRSKVPMTTKTIYPLRSFIEHLSGNAVGLTSLKMTFKDSGLKFNPLAFFQGLRNLEHFEILGLIIDDIDNDLCKLVAHWRKIQTLRLPVGNPTSVSLSTLILIAKSCPDLIFLQIPIAIPSDTISFAPVVLSHPLSSLSVGSPDSSTNFTDHLDVLYQVAYSLYAAFPGIRQIQGDGNEFWMEVQNLLITFHKVQEIGQKRAAINSSGDGLNGAKPKETANPFHS